MLRMQAFPPASSQSGLTQQRVARSPYRPASTTSRSQRPMRVRKTIINRSKYRGSLRGFGRHTHHYMLPGWSRYGRKACRSDRGSGRLPGCVRGRRELHGADTASFLELLFRIRNDQFTKTGSGQTFRQTLRGNAVVCRATRGASPRALGSSTNCRQVIGRMCSAVQVRIL